jgi:uncharacterized protein
VADENVELVRAAIEAFNEGDEKRILELIDPEMEGHDPDRTGEVARGIDGFTRFMAEWLENWDDYRIDAKEIIDAGNQVVVLGRQRGTGKGSGIEIEDNISMVFRVRDGKAVEYWIFGAPERALAHAGIEQ